ncbi:site-specific integrase (plasmid) [Cupriavidus pauculus]|nr:integrase [Cupriavidus metallidurans]KAB0595209.1 site-specific integrase [Cupriavidus pauculus]UAL03981.1 site-specific integrase [Cupriavidus pauculus]
MDRLCRHLILAGVRASNPAAELRLADQWLQEEPERLYLPEEVDARLQEFVRPLSGDNSVQLRCRAIVAFFLGTGVTAGEGRMTRVQDLHPATSPLYLHVPAKNQKSPRIIDLESFAIAPLSAWLAIRSKAPVYGDLLFTLKRTGTPITYMSLGKIVREAFDAIGFDAADMSPRILRNTYCRRALLQGLQREEITRRLGLSSNRTVDRLAQSIRR